ncbi:Ca2+ regulator and membrane fusion protein Fig1-domain-containing protein [Cercophora newfieldiana]|uniref:Ca2+ regulator and membrane fusion protein Fig1-domain-containing protein n=1 Tax=Cercophora newfieldiana TaxID=92897 RepID=A0AA39YLI2_9PEZI|nr:Ca2+ regulator and membrane fusion protein Fig1-domain-containing protein [Cercophora newfieldiana]
MYPITSQWKSAGKELIRRIVSLRRPVQVLNCGAIIVHCLLLTSCSSPNFLADIFICSFSSKSAQSADPQLEIRVGYFFLCAKTERDTHWACGNNDYVREHLLGQADPFSIHRTAYDLQNEAISSSMNIVSAISILISIFLVSSFPLIRQGGADSLRYDWWFMPGFIANPVMGITSCLLAAVWQHSVAATAAPLMQYLSQGAVTAVVGPVATALAWTAFCLSTITGVITVRAGYAITYRRDWVDEISSIASSESSEEIVSLTGSNAQDDEGSGIEMAPIRAGAR